MDYVALGILLGLLVFSLVMFAVIRSQSRKSEHPEAQKRNYTEPTPLYHAPVGSQADFSRSMISLALLKGGNENDSSSRVGIPDPSTTGGSGRRLFFEDTGTGAGLATHGGRHIETV